MKARRKRRAAVGPGGNLAGLRVLVTAGPTVEDIDPVRFLSNRSTGRMGVALALAAARRGAGVVLVHGPLSVAVPRHRLIEPAAVRSAQEMYAAVMARAGDVDVAILCAAVADFTPVRKSPRKIKKDDGRLATIRLKRTRDILAALGRMRRRPFLVGFAAETHDVARHARQKLERKNCDLLCANDVSEAGSGFATDTNRVTIYRRGAKPIALPKRSKDAVAARILDEVASTFHRVGGGSNPREKHQ